MKIRRLNSLASLDLRDYVQRNPDTSFPFGASAYVDFQKDSRFRSPSSTAFPINGVDLEYSNGTVSNGTGVYVPGNERTMLLNGRVAYDFDFSNVSILGLRVPSASRNLLFGSNNFGGSSWTRTNITVGGSVAGPNLDTSATRVTATANNASLTQARTGISSARRFYVFAKSATSAEVPIDLTLNNFSTVSGAQLTQTWRQFGLSATQATPTLGIRLKDSGTSIDLWAGDYETGAAAGIQMRETLINTTTAGSATITNGTVGFGIAQLIADEIPKEALTLYYEVIPRVGSGFTRLTLTCEDGGIGAGELNIDISNADILLSGNDRNDETIDNGATLIGSVCKISILYTRSTQDMFVMIGEELIGPYPMGFPVAVLHVGDSTSLNRTQHYVRKIGIWERVLSIGELRSLWNGAAE